MKTKLIPALAIGLISSSLYASSEGITDKQLNDYPIAGFSRLCCALGMNTMEVKFGITEVRDRSMLGKHSFGQLNGIKDNVGMAYTCRAGFVDTSHLRDNADWSAHVYFKLKEWLGSGKEVTARNEGGFEKRQVYFPAFSAEELATLTEKDREQLAVAIGFNLALMHETATAFKISVSVPSAFFANEKASAFSAEDAYSNLLGNILGVKAAKSPLPFNEAMTQILDEELADLGAQSKQTTLDAFELVRNDWWIRGLYSTFKHTLKRDFTYTGVVEPRRIENAPFCAPISSKTVSIPDKLSNGRSVNDYFEIRATMNKKLKKGIRKLGVKVEGELNQTELPELIDAIKADFVEKLGEDILH